MSNGNGNISSKQNAMHGQQQSAFSGISNRNSSNTLSSTINSLSGGLTQQVNTLMGFNASSLNSNNSSNTTNVVGAPKNGSVVSSTNSNLKNLLLVQQLLSSSLPQLQNAVNNNANYQPAPNSNQSTNQLPTATNSLTGIN